MKRLLCIGAVVGLMAGCAPESAPPAASLTVAAAADLTPAFTELGALFSAQTGIEVAFNFGSTGQLTQQIEQGAPVDVFAAANQQYIDDLDAQGLLLSDSVAIYARGRLTLWTSAPQPFALDDLTSAAVRRIAIANPEHAPYGVAARQVLQRLGVWQVLQPKLVFGENIAQTLQYAESGSVDVALVALSLSIAAGDSGRWVLIDEALHDPLNQALAVIKRTPHEAEARQFAAFVNSPQGREVMQRYGFVLPGEDAAAP